MTNVGQDKGDYAPEHRAQRNTRHPGDHKAIQSDGRRNKTYFSNPDKEHTEPYGVKAKGRNRGKDNGNGEHKG